MFNRALRTLEVNAIIQMGRFIRDLHFHIGKLHSEQSRNDPTSVFTVYRGQSMSEIEFQKIRDLVQVVYFYSIISYRPVMIEKCLCVLRIVLRRVIRIDSAFFFDCTLIDPSIRLRLHLSMK